MQCQHLTGAPPGLVSVGPAASGGGPGAALCERGVSSSARIFCPAPLGLRRPPPPFLVVFARLGAAAGAALVLRRLLRREAWEETGEGGEGGLDIVELLDEIQVLPLNVTGLVCGALACWVRERGVFGMKK